MNKKIEYLVVLPLSASVQLYLTKGRGYSHYVWTPELVSALKFQSFKGASEHSIIIENPKAKIKKLITTTEVVDV